MLGNKGFHIPGDPEPEADMPGFGSISSGEGYGLHLPKLVGHTGIDQHDDWVECRFRKSYPGEWELKF